MADLLDANAFRAGVFGAAALAMLVAWQREQLSLNRIGTARHHVLWPTCWLLIAAVYATMALALAFDLSTSLGGLGRDVARNEAWYESRRPVQTLAVVTLGVIWLTTIVVGIWRVPERRRRYLPSALLCASLVCFAMVRLVSLHQVDAVVARASVGGTPIGTVVELVGVLIAVGLALGAVRKAIPDTASQPMTIDHLRT